jgi:phage terminase small subunit
VAVGLTLKQRRFAKELPTAPSAAEAARRAGYKDSPCEAAKVQASVNLTKPNVLAAVAKEQAKVEKQARLTLDQWFAKLEKLASGESECGAQAQIAALKLYAQACGWLTERVEQSGEVTKRIVFATSPTDKTDQEA